MVFAPHTRVSFGGALKSVPGGTEDEIWNCNVNITKAAPDFGPLDDPATYMTEVQAALSSWFAAGTSYMSSSSTLQYLKVNNIASTGKYSDPFTTNRYDYTPEVPGGTSPNAPDILSVCLSWTTARMRGPGSHGRIYPPNLGALTTSRMFIDATMQASLATCGRALLVLLQNTAGTQHAAPVVASGVGVGTNTVITGVRVGSVVDVQRRRKNALVETYVGLAL